MVPEDGVIFSERGSDFAIRGESCMMHRREKPRTTY